MALSGRLPNTVFTPETPDDELLQVVEQHLPRLWRLQKHVGNHSLLTVLKTAERQIAARQLVAATHGTAISLQSD